MSRYVDADELLARLKSDALWKLIARYNIEGVIEASPTADVVPVRHGKWLAFPEALQFEALTEDDIACSVCGHSFNMIDNNTEEFNYCPHCGARMDAE